MNRSIKNALIAFCGLLLLAVPRESSAQKVSSLLPQLGSTTLVISQAYGGGGGASGTYIFDYVELKNISNTAQSLNGLQLMYGSATGQFGSSSTNILALPNVTLQPGQYFLVQLSTAGTGGAALPVTPDVVTTNLSMSGTSGKVALVTAAFTGNTCGATATPCTLPNANIVDLVAWGAAGNAEGGFPTNGGTAITATQGNVRKGAGCTDTDNNNSDFDIVTAPVPHNSASTAAPCGVAVIHHVPLDFNGDGKTDFALTRDSGGFRTWYVLYNGSANFDAPRWGIDSDHNTPADYDGDGKTDVAVWREGAQSTFYILRSSDGTVKIDNFGQSGDQPKVVRDYDGDGKADVAVYRDGATAGTQSFFYYRGSLNNPNGNITFIPWGVNGDVPTSGDFDGDGKGDFAIRRNIGGNGVWYIAKSGGGTDVIFFGLSSDAITPGDFDGDGKTDLTAARPVGSAGNFYWHNSSDGTITGPIVGANPTTDFLACGDYDGDGKTDIAVWRSTDGTFYVRSTGSGNWSYQPWGTAGDNAVGEWNITGGN